MSTNNLFISDNEPVRICLVSMPWALFNRPSIQLGTLKAYLASTANWISADTTHPFLETAKILGTELYQWISQNPWISEALYAPLLFPDKTADAEALAVSYVKKADKKIQKSFNFLQISQSLEQHLIYFVDRYDWPRYLLVGFTVCFNQLLPSLAAAKLIKDKFPHLPIVLGGSSCTAEAGKSLVKVFPFIDYVIAGEGEQALLELSEFISGRRSSLTRLIVSNMEYTQHVPDSPCSNQQLSSLGPLPVPDYYDYFAEQRKWFSDNPFIPVLPLEFSRGCWWNKCSFCNLNLQWCGYRHKKSNQVVNEVTTLAARHDCLDFTFVDNMLPPQESRLFFSTTADMTADFSFFAEIRVTGPPNSINETYALYRKGGLSTIQVGIEALSNALLKKMRKGTTVIENIAAMRSAVENGLELRGNLIVHFPGCSPEETVETLENLDFVFPFTPLSLASFFLGIDSPMYNAPAAYGIKAIVNHQNNNKLFPPAILNNLKLILQGYRGDRLQQRKIWKPVVQKVKAWQEYHNKRKMSTLEKPLLFYRDGMNFLLLRQELIDGTVLNHRLKNSSRQIYLFCSQLRTSTEIFQHFPKLPQKKILSFLRDLTKKRLIFSENDMFLALAVHSRKQK